MGLYICRQPTAAFSRYVAWFYACSTTLSVGTEQRCPALVVSFPLLSDLHYAVPFLSYVEVQVTGHALCHAQPHAWQLTRLGSWLVAQILESLDQTGLHAGSGMLGLSLRPVKEQMPGQAQRAPVKASGPSKGQMHAGGPWQSKDNGFFKGDASGSRFAPAPPSPVHRAGVDINYLRTHDLHLS